MALLTSLLTCEAQEIRKGNIELSAGASFPVGEFGYKHADFEGSGFAEYGICLALSFTYRLNAQMGLVARVSENMMGVHETGAGNRYWIPEYGYNWTVESGPWLTTAFLGGLDLIIPLYLSDFYFRLLGGAASARLPRLTGTAYNFIREASSGLAAAWSVGMGVRYQSFKKVTLSFGIDFLVSNHVLDEVWSSDLGASGSGKIYQNMVTFNLRAGLGIRIF